MQDPECHLRPGLHVLLEAIAAAVLILGWSAAGS